MPVACLAQRAKGREGQPTEPPTAPAVASGADGRYSMIFETTPAPTVRPPSRMAKRSFSSMAIGEISVDLEL